MRGERIRVGDVLALERIPVDPAPDREYVSIGIRSFGKGIFHYEPKPGDSLGSLRFLEVHPNRLMISNIKGWEGAIAMSGPHDEGCVASNRFLSYVAKDDRIDIRWACWFFLSELGIDLIQRASPGSADRNRTLAIDRFEALEIPLPRIDHQRYVASELDRHKERSRMLEAALAVRPQLLELLPRLLDGLVGAVASYDVTVGELVTFAGKSIHSSEAERQGLEFVGLEHVEPHSGRAIGSSSPGEANGPKKMFDEGDITYPRLRPYQNKVWLADRAGVCSSDQLVLRPRDIADGPVLAAALRSQSVLDQAIEMTSSLQLPRLRQASLGQLRVRLPRDRGQFLERGAAVTQSILNARSRHEQQTRLARSYLPAALNEAFAELE